MTYPDNRDRELEYHRRRRNEGAWAGAVALIVIGVVFLLRNAGVTFPGNWWALFLVIPILGALGSAWQTYRRDGGASNAVVGSVVAAIVLTALMVALLLDIDIEWHLIWPVVLILLGIALLLRNFRRW